MSTTFTTSGEPRTTPRVGPRPSSGTSFRHPTRSWGSVARASLEERIRIQALDDGSSSEGDVRLEVSLVTPAEGAQPWGYSTVSAWVYVDGRWTGVDALARLGSQLERSGVLVDLSDGRLTLLGATGGRIPVSARLVVSNRSGDRSSHWGLVTGKEWADHSSLSPESCNCAPPGAKSESVEPVLGEAEAADAEGRGAQSIQLAETPTSKARALNHDSANQEAPLPAADLAGVVDIATHREIEGSTGKTIRMLVDETDNRETGAFTGTRKFP